MHKKNFAFAYVRIYLQKTLDEQKKLYLAKQNSAGIHKQTYTHFKYLPATPFHPV